MSKAPKIIFYGNDDHILTVLVECSDGEHRSYNIVLPNSTPAPDEYQLVGYIVLGSDYNKGHIQLKVTYDGFDYLIPLQAESLDAMNRFQWFMLPFFRPLYPYEVENLKKWGYTQ